MDLVVCYCGEEVNLKTKKKAIEFKIFVMI